MSENANEIELGPKFAASDYTNDGKTHVLLSATGSVATIKLPNIIEALGRHKEFSIRVILTQSAETFLGGQSAEQPTLQQLRQMDGVDGIYLDRDEWIDPWVRKNNILHIELRRWADALLISPLSANSLAKITMGIADNLLLSVVRAWDTSGTIDIQKKRRPRIFLAPAMNTAMWRHPLTAKQIGQLETSWGSDNGWITVLMPMAKELACGDVGDGAMQDWREIVKAIEEYFAI
ncbi:hypothetical protein FQN57_000275 [Myotisia sp. PD_48]|nr:hypothetical protein FQN57_000275 [Myotisia sp. PD_48]